ncbi:single-stranded DNA-binding protein [Herbiconiux sp. CPCC 203407]|uniref:Single-stranded DNA-binding protein n=1 Tax=Herbiconiux oxytropis TaxID=2970915 RepID=A0AA41XA26_9MICO|nr:single-stranded DNA-binding protein [Herbiconiux oxytropis]MCS5720900.1 single-stranded DNA-binding protein [Herbiconiux oxytropis]MCS5724377.1 single-stranded DNA-binding protein [Herbiconiux oxytropis]
MPDHLTLTGVVATPPRHVVTNSGLDIVSFRLASAQRRYDKSTSKWVDADTNWYTVSAFRQLAQNVLVSIERGQHVVVTGRLRIRSWEAGEKTGLSVEVDADAIGHDLSWGTSVHTRSLHSPSGSLLGQQGRDAEGFPSGQPLESHEPEEPEQAARVGSEALLPF